MHSAKGSLKKVVLPIALEWYITGSCNLRCKYCGEHTAVSEPRPYLSFADKVIELAPKHVWLGGGEPALVSELPKILAKLKSAINVTLGLSTNLTLLETVKDALPYIDDLIVSLDTADEEICRQYRCVSPSDIIGNIRALSDERRAGGLGVNITVNSVVYKDSLKNGGVEKLNDSLFGIDPGMWHIFCPLYPESYPGSIVNDKESTAAFFGIIDKLKRQGRNIMVDFPTGAGGRVFSAGPLKCFRRYFRVQMSENGEIYSPCGDAQMQDPVCESPCNCAGFIDDILSVKGTSGLLGSPVKNRFNTQESAVLYDFIRKNVNPDIRKEYLLDLSNVKPQGLRQ